MSQSFGALEQDVLAYLKNPNAKLGIINIALGIASESNVRGKWDTEDIRWAIRELLRKKLDVYQKDKVLQVAILEAVTIQNGKPIKITELKRILDRDEVDFTFSELRHSLGEVEHKNYVRFIEGWHIVLEDKKWDKKEKGKKCKHCNGTGIQND